MTIRMNCPGCDEALEIEPSLAGKHTRCGRCGSPFVVRSPEVDQAESAPLEGQGIQEERRGMTAGDRRSVEGASYRERWPHKDERRSAEPYDTPQQDSSSVVWIYRAERRHARDERQERLRQPPVGDADPMTQPCATDPDLAAWKGPRHGSVLLAQEIGTRRPCREAALASSCAQPAGPGERPAGFDPD
jgi:hypothetical protein